MKRLIALITLLTMLLCAFSSCGHTHSFTDDWDTIKPATCTENGEKIRYCTCGEKQTQIIYAIGHQYINGVCDKCGDVRDKDDTPAVCEHKKLTTIPAIVPTCYEHGYTEGKKCSTCNEIIVYPVVVPSPGHSFGPWEIIQEATYNQLGIKTRTCVCGEKEELWFAFSKQAEYNTYTSIIPSNWNELTYLDDNNTQILNYIVSPFFEYDYKFENDIKYNEDGSINKDGIVSGAYTVNYSAATKLEDVTSTVDAKWGYTDEQKAEGGYAWKITLRDDLKWDDGTPISAANFVYSMQAQLDPAFMNYHGNTYYDTLGIKNSRGYFFQNQEGTYESVLSQGFNTNEAAIAAGKTLCVDIHSLWGASGYTSADGKTAPQWVTIDDATVYYSADGTDYISGAWLWNNYSSILGPTGPYAPYVTILVENLIHDVKWEDVGIYAEGNAIVICLDKAYSFLNNDGSLSVWAPYYMSRLPLVHPAKYEAAKIAPADGATLWTSKYNSDLMTTASWGPYKLVAFEAGSHYVLAKNENWYGWNMEEYKNQYNVTAITCVKIAEESTQWLMFLTGDLDDAPLTTYNTADYKDSKYANYAPGTGTYFMQLYSNLSVLKESENNNGILAIPEFRQAFSLALDRADVVNTIWPGTAIPNLGLINPLYYYDVENSRNLADGGVYRNTVEAKVTILHAYGFTEDINGMWTNGNISNLTLDEAYESLTGYNPTLAKQKLVEAYNILVADAEKYGYDSTKKISIIYGASVHTQKQVDRAAYLQKVLNDLSAGTPLEGQFEIVLDASAGDQWPEAFRNGDTQIGFGYGFSGDAFDAFYVVGGFIDPDHVWNYHNYWDTSSVNLTLALPEGNYEGAGQTITMSALNWYYCLMDTAGEYDQYYRYDWSEGSAPVQARLKILAALEELVIKENRSVTLISDYYGSFLGAQFSQFSEDYNYFMGFGGIRYMVVNYTDAEWVTFVEQNNGDLTKIYKES